MECLIIKGKTTEDTLKEIERINKHNAYTEFKRLWTLHNTNNLNSDQQKAVFEFIKKAYDFKAWNDLIIQITPLIKNNMVSFNFIGDDL